MERLKTLLKQEKAVNWDRVFASELPCVLNYFRFHGVETSVAEDLTATTFEKAWKARQTYLNEKSTVSTWLFTIAHHTMIDHFRAHKNELFLDVLDTLPDGLGTRYAEEAVQKTDENERLRRLLLLLPERDQELIALKYGAEMTNRMIAKQTGLSESNVGTILNRIVLSLRRQMEVEL